MYFIFIPYCRRPSAFAHLSSIGKNYLFYHTSYSGEDDILVWKFSSRGRSMMQQKLDFLSAPDYSHGHRDWSNQETNINNICCNASGTLVCASRGSLLNIWSVSGGQAHVDSSQSHVMCATWPMVSESTLKQVRSKDALLIGRLDGSVAVIDVKDCMHYNRVEIEYCKREGRLSFITNELDKICPQYPVSLYFLFSSTHLICKAALFLISQIRVLLFTSIW